MAAITQELARFVAGISYDALPASVPDRTKALALDLVGIMLRARNDAESTPAMLSAAARLGLANGTCTVVGDSDGYAPPGAAMVNGTLAHSLDFDDTHAPGSLHPSAPIVPAALAAAEMAGADGKALIAAIVSGYEVQIRLSLALDPAAHYDQGFHPTASAARSAPPRPRDGCWASTPPAFRTPSASCSACPRARCNSSRMAPGPSARTSGTPRCAV